MMVCRGIRGATTVDVNQTQAILAATRALLERISAVNSLSPVDVASVIFTVTPDLDAVAPARAAREMGWRQVPLLCMPEMAVPGSLPMCIRVLIHWNTDCPQERIRHIYLNRARTLRPDLVSQEEK